MPNLSDATRHRILYGGDYYLSSGPRRPGTRTSA